MVPIPVLIVLGLLLSIEAIRLLFWGDK